MISLVAPALLAALIVVETVGAPEGGSLELDARVLGVGACAVALRAGAGTLPAVALAAVVTALLRAVSSEASSLSVRGPRDNCHQAW